MRATLLYLFLVISSCALSQTQPQQPRPKKILTPDQIVFQAQMKIYYAEHSRVVAAANSAYTAEAAREKAPECPNAATTYDINMCLSREGDITDTNYKAFTSALRAMLALPAPTFPGEITPAIGPSGREATPATNTAAFDAAEAAWQTYATAECNAVDTFWRGGTIVNAMVGECNLRLARARLHELNDAYDMPLHH
jgi:uncharacterized protein YecT (DUF1311 family)